ncbi:MAG: DNA primase [Vicinamibacteria bacterium]
MARYTDDSKDRVKDATNLVELAGEFTELRRSGPDQFVGRCPLHEERTGSFTITASRQLFHCFGCGAGGDALELVQRHLGLDFIGALEHLARRASIELEREAESAAAAAHRQRTARRMALVERAAQFYTQHLRSAHGQRAIAYLASRGLHPPIIETFAVGVAPSGPHELLTAAAKAGFDAKELLAAGLAQRRHGTIEDRFRDRIMFPTTGWRGNIVGFGARRLKENGAKYVNSPQSAWYQKGSLLYGASHARPHAAREGRTIVVEGYTDALALHQAGVQNTVATMGTAVTDEQITLLKRLAPAATLVLDGDSSGTAAALKAGPLAAAAGLDVKVAVLPAGADPADIAQDGGPDAIAALLADAVTFPRFQVDRAIAAADLADPEGKDALIDTVRPVIAALRPGAQREDLIDRVAAAVSFTPTVVRSWLQDTTSADNPDGAGAPADEFAVLDAALRDPKLRLDLDPAVFTDPLHRRAAEHVHANPDDPAGSIPADDPGLARLLTLMLTANPSPTPEPDTP